MRKVMGSNTLLGRPYVIYQWLLVLKRINPLCENDDIPEFDVVKALTEKMNSVVLNESEKTTSKEVIQRDIEESDDIASVRTSIHRGDATDSLDERYDVEDEEQNEQEISMTSCYVTKSTKRNTIDLKTNSTRYEALFDAFGLEEDDKSEQKEISTINDEEQKDELDISLNGRVVEEESKNHHVSKRSNDCLNEFTSNGYIMTAAFFQTFLLGKSFKEKNRHLLLRRESILSYNIQA